MGVDQSYLVHWLNLAESSPRHSFFITAENVFVKNLEEELKTLIPSTSVVVSEMDLKDSIQPFSDNSVRINWCKVMYRQKLLCSFQRHLCLIFTPSLPY